VSEYVATQLPVAVGNITWPESAPRVLLAIIAGETAHLLRNARQIRSTFTPVRAAPWTTARATLGIFERTTQRPWRWHLLKTVYRCMILADCGAYCAPLDISVIRCKTAQGHGLECRNAPRSPQPKASGRLHLRTVCVGRGRTRIRRLPALFAARIITVRVGRCRLVLARDRPLAAEEPPPWQDAHACRRW